MPLGNTLAAKAPSTSSYSGPEASDVETLTLSNRFNISSDHDRRPAGPLGP